jgi:hypothetical protein
LLYEQIHSYAFLYEQALVITMLISHQMIKDAIMASATEPPVIEENKQLVRNYVEDVLNRLILPEVKSSYNHNGTAGIVN